MHKIYGEFVVINRRWLLFYGGERLQSIKVSKRHQLPEKRLKEMSARIKRK